MTAHLLEKQRTDDYAFTDAADRQTPDRSKRSMSALTPNSTSDATDIALDVGAALLTALSKVCRYQGRLCIPGQKGRTGLPGIKGETGLQGGKGEAGIDGLSGIPGLNGTHGDKGSKGGLGQTGRGGAPGLKGDQGVAGLHGEVGSPGEQGLQGERGESGDPGSQGLKGERGSKGDQGEKGEKGEAGFIRHVPDNRVDVPAATQNNTAYTGQLQPAKGDEEGTETPTHPSCDSRQYSVLKDTWRRESVPIEGACAQQYSVFQAGWYRFSKRLGAMIKTRCPQTQGCRAVAPGWMRGGHPAQVGVAQSRVVCFSFEGNCCSRQVTVEVVNCGDYYVYNLPEIPTCYYEYCGNAY